MNLTKALDAYMRGPVASRKRLLAERKNPTGEVCIVCGRLVPDEYADTDDQFCWGEYSGDCWEIAGAYGEDCSEPAELRAIRLEESE